jgi:hypothetical protein
MLSGMKKLMAAGALVATGLLLTACAPSIDSAAEKCGGEKAGIFVEDAGLRYHQDNDSTGAAWTCLLQELVPDKADQYSITQDMHPGETGTAFLGGLNIAYGIEDDGAVMILFFESD